jgi:micrococcal nuclease
MYEYKCKIIRVIDGDSVVVDIDVGFGVWLTNEHIRLNGIDAPEVRTRDLAEKAHGLGAKARLEELLNEGCYLKTFSGRNGEDERGKFGRILGDFVLNSGTYVTEILISEGWAVEYVGQNRDEIEADHLKNRDRLIEEGTLQINLQLDL